ncbi:cytosine-purine permease [Rhizoctonia solani]|uniref:Cytosine-purine permease n=2 Tax=Rhizoctonia solani TaxID=456999 RepID=A0A8H7HBS9_9AGAM|nr:cytosine-purine permease [Rhizoctonia solani]
MALSEPSFDYDPFYAYDHDREAKETSFASLLGVAARAIKLRSHSPADMDPVPMHQRSWTMWDYTSYWLSDGFNVATVSLTSKLGTKSILYEGAALMTQNSFVYAGCWFILETSAPRDCYRSLYHRSCSNGRSHNKIPGSDFDAVIGEWNDWSKTSYSCLPESANITTVDMMCYFFYWLIQLPFLLISPHKIRYLFIAKAVLAPVTGLSMMTWAFVKTGGGPIFEQKATISGSALSWAMLSAMNSAIGNYATLSVNIPDFTRYARSPRDQYIQVLIIPVIFTFFAFMGIAVTSAGNVIYGEILWNPLTLIDHWDNRAAAFFASFVFCLATIGTNVSANSISAANDFTALLPKAGRLWLNIKRGQILCALIGGWVVCPWEILGSAIGFLNFMGGYTVFLGPICSIMIVDYWLVHKGNIDIPALYDPKGRYRYVGGVNWRALLALCVSVPPNLPGLIHSINPKIDVGLGGQHLFSIAWLLGFSLAGVTYFITSTLFPPRETMVDELITGDDQTSQSNDLENVTDEKHSDVKVKVTTQAA